MLFNSFEFLLFLPVAFLFYWFVFRSRKAQNFFLIVASYVFYGWWDWRFLLLIVFTSLCSFVSGLLLERYEDSRRAQKAISAANIVVNLVVLGFFKYFNFFVESLNSLVSGISGYELGWVTLNVILPVGISFYTFQALSYSIDVYKHSIKATHDPVEFFAYISFFPQLVAGPIERANNLLPQFQKERHFEYVQSVDGLRQMLWGFFKKLVVADNCAMAVNEYWTSYADLSGFMLIMLGVLFTIQIYCDFSGYTDIAIGCARLFGFNLKRNFNYPYFSRSIPEFWRRWHISLTTWIRDYVYIPLGGNRCENWKVIRNVFIVWGISGLWHGANWTFVCWGLYHGTFIVIYRLFGLDNKNSEGRVQERLSLKMKHILQAMVTFALVVIGWIIFRAESMEQAVDYFASIGRNTFFAPTQVYGKVALLIGLVVLFIEWLQKDKQHALQLDGIKLFRRRAVRWATYYLLLIIIAKYKGDSQDFIYFQF